MSSYIVCSEIVYYVDCLAIGAFHAVGSSFLELSCKLQAGPHPMVLTPAAMTVPNAFDDSAAPLFALYCQFVMTKAAIVLHQEDFAFVLSSSDVAPVVIL